jgi:FkbM family methyltransferase
VYWFENPLILRQFPLPLRCYAAYCRSMFVPSTKTVRGGSFLLGLMRQTRQLLHGPAEAVVSVDGLTIHLDPYADRLFFAFEELLQDGDEGRIMRQSISPGDTFLDVGANHGTYALLARRLVGQGGSVHAFEPQPHLAGLLKKSFRSNRFVNCFVHEVALSDRDGHTSFYIPPHSGLAGIHKKFSGNSGFREIQVKMSRFDDAVNWEKLPGRIFLKLDIEGSELPFLRGAANMIWRRRPIILMEINPASAEAAGYRVEDIVSQLKTFGYSRFAEMDRYPNTYPLEEMRGERMTRFQDIVVLP